MDVNKYVGLPYAENGRGPAYDCYGLVRLVYADRLGVVLPSYDGCYHGHTDPMLPELILCESKRWIKTDHPEPLDVIRIRINGKPLHVGLFMRPGWMLHQLHGCESCTEQYTNPLWSKRIDGFYRYHPDHR